MFDRQRLMPSGGVLGIIAHKLGFDRQPNEELVAYARQVQPLVRRAKRLYRAWLARAQDLPNPDELANAASVLRWEFATALESLAAVAPPSRADRVHAQLRAGLTDAARAAQLIGAGYRSTTYGTVCDGQSLFARTDARMSEILELLSGWAPDVSPTAAVRRAPVAEWVRRAS
jgi:hypothetical protein